MALHVVLFGSFHHAPVGLAFVHLGKPHSRGLFSTAKGHRGEPIWAFQDQCEAFGLFGLLGSCVPALKLCWGA